MGDSAGRTADSAGRTAEDSNSASNENTGPKRPADDAPESEWKAWSRHWEKIAKERGTSLGDVENKLKEYEDRDKSELDKLRERAERAERAKQDAELKAVRLEIATSKGLPAAMAARLRGNTKAELEADADELKALLKPSESEPESGGRPNRDPDQGKGNGHQPQGGSGDMNAWIRGATGRPAH